MKPEVLDEDRVKTPRDSQSTICNKLNSKGSLPKNNVKKCKLSQLTRGSWSMERYK